MSSDRSVPYHLRPNKAVDRGVFVELLTKVVGRYADGDFRYIGMGGPFLEDFRLIHSRTAIRRMTCVERDDQVHERQRFNLPLAFIEREHSELESYLASQELGDVPCAVWLDYTDASELRERLEFFAHLIKESCDGSVLKITLNSNPRQLGERNGAGQEELHIRRLGELRARLGDYLPVEVGTDDMVRLRFGRVLIGALRLAIEKQIVGSGTEFLGVCSFLYSDGQPMVSATGVVLDPDGSEAFLTDTRLNEWEFFSDEWWKPTLIDMPILSTRERLRIEQGLHEADTATMSDLIGFELPRSALASSVEMMEMCRQFYRHYPHFGKIDL